MQFRNVSDAQNVLAVEQRKRRMMAMGNHQQQQPWSMYGYAMDFTSDSSQGLSFIDFGEGDGKPKTG